MAKRQNRIRYKPGDIFRIPLPRGRVTFGRILLDLVKISTETKLFDRIAACPLNSSLTGGGLLVEIYNRRGRKPVDEQLRGAARFPLFVTFRDPIFQGEFEIVGHLAVAASELNFPEGTVGIEQRTGRGYTADSTTQYHFQKGGVSVSIEYSLEASLEFGGIPGCSSISAGSVRDAIDGRADAIKEFVGDDLRLSPKRKRILKLAGLTPGMTYREMAISSNGILPEEMISVTESLFPGTTIKALTSRRRTEGAD